jgi:predicted secreted Zn-dependent protease
MVEFTIKNSRRAIAEKRQEFEARLAKIKREEERLKQASVTQDRPRKKQVCTFRSETYLIKSRADNLGFSE